MISVGSMVPLCVAGVIYLYVSLSMAVVKGRK
jgi:hypothetical protein